MSIKQFLILFLILIVGSVIYYFNSSVKNTIMAAENNIPLNGWAWSSNIGWINFNCEDQGVCGQSNYKVNVDLNTGKLNGYAWSSNIGWIRFDYPSSNAPENPKKSAELDLTTGVLSGWARACSVFQNGCSGSLKNDLERGGWDGWIKITDATVSNNTGRINGWAWGSDIVGWLNFYNTTVVAATPYCSFNASPTEIILPQSSTLSWDCVYVDNCSIDQEIGLVNNSGSIEVRPTQTTTYTLSCYGNIDKQIYKYEATIKVNQPKAKYKEIIPR